MNHSINSNAHSPVAGAAGLSPGRCKSRGQAMIELALCLPIVFYMTMLMIQFSILYNTSLALTNLAREGVRYAAYQGDNAYTPSSTTTSTDTATRDHIRAVAAGTVVAPADLFPDTRIGISPAAGTRTLFDAVTVTIHYDMRKKFFLPAGFNFVLSAYSTGDFQTTGTMAVQQAPTS